MPKKKKNDFHDEWSDYTVAEMNVEGMPGYIPPEELKKRREIRELSLTKDERRAMIKGAYRALLPIFFIGLGIFCLAFGLVVLYMWFVSR